MGIRLGLSAALPAALLGLGWTLPMAGWTGVVKGEGRGLNRGEGAEGVGDMDSLS